jgi:hypothetical protein
MLASLEGLTDREYEALGCVASELSGATDYVLTPAGDDKGVDFFASIRWPGHSHVFSHRSCPLRIVGQSKKYGNPVDNDRMKIFVQTLNEIRHQEPRVEDLVPAWFRVASGPILGWMITQYGLQSGAETTARNHGIMYSDIRDIVEITALSRKVASDKNPSGRANFLVEKILAVPGI